MQKMLSLVTALGLMWGTSTVAQSTAANPAYVQGIQALEQGAWQEAEGHFRQILSLPEYRTEAALRLLQCGLEANNWRTYQKALEVLQAMRYPHLSVAHYLALARLALQDQEHWVALDALQKGRLIDQNNPELLLVQAELYRDQNRQLAALQCLEQAAFVAPKASIYNELASLYLQKGDTLSALETYQRTLQLEPNDKRALLALGALNLSLSEREPANTNAWLQRAADCYERYQTAYPKDRSALELLRAIYELQGKATESERVRRLLAAAD